MVKRKDFFHSHCLNRRRTGRRARSDRQHDADILSYSRSRGLFAGTYLNGSAITEDESDARSLYGSPLPLTEILAGKTQPPDAGRTFVNEVAKYAGQSRQKE